MVPARLFTLSLTVFLLALAGCGSGHRTVTKAEYEVQLAASSQAIRVAGQELGKSRTVADLSGGVSGFQKALRDGQKRLNRLEPPANARTANNHLAHAFGDLADALETVKSADTMVKAQRDLGLIGSSTAIKEGQAAIAELKRLGYTGAAAP
jgi:hypothetical protein